MAFLGELLVKIAADTAEFLSDLDKSQKALTKAADSMIKTGKALTVAITLPILAIGGALVKTASDAEETSSKFNAVFRDMKTVANDTADALAKNYGLSSNAARQLLADTGDLLTGFGFTQESALDLSNQVNQLAVDLASFTNFAGGAEGASVALTKALIGESEQAKALGIVIRQDSDEYINLVKFYMEAEGLSILQAKAMTALEIATRQSGNAIGDYARTSKSTANQMKLLGQDVNDLAVSFGNRLLPAANELIQSVSEFVEWLTNMDKGAKDAIIRVASLAASIGPLILGVGLAIKAFVGLRAVMAHALGPIGLVTAAFLTLAAIAGDFKDNAIAKALENAVQPGRDLEAEITKIMIATGKTRDEVLELGSGHAAIKQLIIEQEEEQVKLNELMRTQNEQLFTKIEGGIKYLLLLKATEPALVGLGVQFDRLLDSILASFTVIEDVIGGGGIGDGFEKAIAPATSYADVLATLKERYDEVDEGLNQWKKDQEEATKVVEEEVDAQTEKVKNGFEQQEKDREDYVEAYKDDMKALYSQLEQWTGVYFDILGDAIVQGRLDWEALKEAFKGTIVALLKMVARQFFVEAMGALFSIIPGSRGRAGGLFAAAAAARLAAGIVAALAEGGVVNPSQGGRQFILGDGGEQEAVLPLNDNVMGRLADRITSNMQPQNNIFQPTNNINFPQQLVLDIGGEQFNATITDRIRNGQIQVPSRALAQR